MVKAEGIGGEREGDFTHNFNVWKMFYPELYGQILSKTGKLLYKTEEDSFYIKLLKIQMKK